MNRHQASAGEWTDIRTSLVVQRQIPSSDRLTPVARDLRECLGPLCPVCGVIRGRVIGTTLSPINLRVGIRIVKLAHLLGRAHVSVERNRVANLCTSGSSSSATALPQRL